MRAHGPTAGNSSSPQYQDYFLMQYGGREIVNGDRPWFVTPVVQCARDKGLQVIDTFEPLEKIFRSDKAAFKRLYVMHENGTVYGHMSAEGNGLIASMIAEQIRKANSRAHSQSDIIGKLDARDAHSSGILSK